MNYVTAIGLFMCVRNSFPILPLLPNVTVAFLPRIRDFPFLDHSSDCGMHQITLRHFVRHLRYECVGIKSKACTNDFVLITL
jgi:hypothetical protein